MDTGIVGRPVLRRRPGPARGAFFSRLACLGSPVRFAFVVAILSGLLFAVIVPPLEGADERDHLARSYQLAFGQFATTRQGAYFGAMLPSGYQDYMGALTRAVYSDRDHTAFERLVGSGQPSGRLEFVDEGTIASYGPGAYIEYLPALSLGTLLHIPLGILIYLARFSGVVAYAVLLSLAVRRIPVHKWLLVAVGLIPEMVNQASTVSADGMTNALLLLLVAWFVRLAMEAETISRRHGLEIGAAAVLLALAKPPYVLFTIAFMVLGLGRRRSVPSVWRLAVTLVAVSVPVSAAWLWYQKSHSSRLDATGLLLVQRARGSYAYHDIAPARQITGLVRAPWELLAVPIRTIQHQGLVFPREMIGLLSLYQLPVWLVLAAGLVLLLAWSVDYRRGADLMPFKGAFTLVIATVALAYIICMIVYVVGNSVGAPRADGLTPRYFLPLIPGVLIGISGLWRRRPPRVRRVRRAVSMAWRVPALQCAIPLVLAASVAATGHFYYATAGVSF